jgi:hypothetical protein
MSDIAQAHVEMIVAKTNILEQDDKQLLVNRQNMVDSENQSSAVVKFLLELKEINLYIAIQSVLDSLDIWLSAIKYYFDAVNPSSGNKSSASMYEWLKTPEGLIFFLVGGVFFGVFAFLGNSYDAKKKDKNTLPAFSKIADENWPFVRDCFKGLKWTFKGTRSVFVVLQILFQQSYVSFITPFGIGFGVLAAANRYWNRKIIENRKVLQSQNDSFRENIKYINTCFLEVDKKWVNQFQYLEPKHQKLYQGCILKLKNASSGLQQFYYVDEKRVDDEACFELKPLYSHQKYDQQIQREDGTQQSFEINATQFEQLNQLSFDERKKYAMCMFILEEKIFFIDKDGRRVFAQNQQNYHISDDQFPGLFNQHGIHFSENKIYREDNFGTLREVLSDFPELGHDKKAFLEHLKHLVQESNQQYTNRCYVFDKQLFYVTPDGWIARYSHSMRCFIFPPGYYSAPLSLVEMQFLLIREEEGEDKLDIFHYDYLLNQKIAEGNSEKKSSEELSKLKLGQILAEKKNYLKTLSNDKEAFSDLYHTPKFQEDYIFAYVSAGLNGILNAPYYFLGLLTMVTIPASFFLPAVGLCSFFMVLNFIAEMYQEFDYQRRLSITEFKAKLSMIKRFISLEWDHINVKIQAVDTTSYEKLCSEPLELNASPATIPSFSSHSELKYNLKMMQTFLTQEEFDSILAAEDTSNRKERFTRLLAEAFKRLHDFQDDFSVKDIESLTKQQVALNFQTKFGRELNAKSFIFSHLKLKQYLSDYNDYQDKLKEKMILPQFPVIMQGIKNGLHCYGVFNGFLMTLASLAFLYGWTFGPQLFALSIGVGFFCVIFGTLYTALFSNLESKAVAADVVAACESPVQAVQASAGSPCGFVLEDKTVPYWYNKKVYGKIISNDNDIQPSKNLLISEQFEVLRQFLSGFKKGIKFLQTIFMLVPAGMPDSNIFVQMLYCVVSLIYGCFFALKGLRGLIRQDPKDYENSVLLGPIFTKDKTEQYASVESPRVVHDNTKFINSALATPLSRGVSPYSSFPSNMNLFAMGQTVETIEENASSDASTPEYFC